MLSKPDRTTLRAVIHTSAIGLTANESLIITRLQEAALDLDLRKTKAPADGPVVLENFDDGRSG
jgi:hypothetical protein